MVSFAKPAHLLWVVLPAIGVVLALWRHRVRLGQQRSLASPSVWRQVLGGIPSTGLVRLLAWCIAAALVAVALARPQWGEIKGEVSIRTRDVVVALDVSDSMRCRDTAPSRLKRSLALLRHALPGLDGNRVAVVVFAGDAYPLVPLTTDLDAVGTFLEGVEPGMISLPGSNLERAVDESLKLLPPEGKGRVLVLISDGENLQGDVKAAASRLRDAGVRMVAVVAGTAEGGPIPMDGRRGQVHYKKDRSGKVVITHSHPEVLKSLAKATGGLLVTAGSAGAAQEIVGAIAKLQSREMESSRRVRRIDRFPLFLVLAVLLILAGFGRSPWRKMAVAAFLLLALTPAVHAQKLAVPAGGAAGGGNTQSPAPRHEVPWWQRWIPGGERRLARRGLKLWKEQKPAEAARAFAQAASLDPKDPTRLYDLGTSLAAGKELKQAAPLLAQADRAGIRGAAYNLGTAALEAGQAAPALQWLRKALLEDPSSPEVKRNYELALRLKEQQKKNQKKDQKKSQEKKSDKQKKNQEEQQRRKNQEREKQQQRSPKAGPTPTPTPGPSRMQGRRPQKPADPLYGALERAERATRKAMRTPVARQRRVEEDW